MAAHSKAFTLLEVMAALAILSVAFVVLIRSHTQCLNNVIRVQHYERGVFITENQLHWTFLDLNEAEHWTEFTDLSGEDGDYKWRVTIEPADMGADADVELTMLHIVATTSWPEGRNETSFELETYYLWGKEE